ncbi:hypothetical protein HGG64_00700 [Mycoplasma phocoeninasale]|uniref:Uncharacterized protein n=2 Tax=Mycoplasma phocoeninasale TaxID=2726117 RepID=A0A858U670_9MOLU|nr:hypothetical protein [Mycoplasma phocoeninasale]QJG66236.1 hypothetical protein HGG64_00700 [Mycoplasma phocoeninasale]
METQQKDKIMDNNNEITLIKLQKSQRKIAILKIVGIVGISLSVIAGIILAILGAMGLLLVPIRLVQSGI